MPQYRPRQDCISNASITKSKAPAEKSLQGVILFGRISTLDKLKLLILFGGVSSEHDISRKSTASVLNNINREKYEITTIGITRDGQWFLTEASPQAIEDGTWQEAEGNRRATVSPDRSVHGIIIEEPDGTFTRKYIDVVFPVMHGQNAEDGTLQGLLHIAGLSFVGPGPAASAAGMDKAITKAMVQQNGTVKQADTFVSHKRIYEMDKASQMAAVKEYFHDTYPLFVKPANAGSSVGITKVKGGDELEGAMDLAFQVDDKLLVEEAIVGREIEVAVLGNEDPQASCVGEIFAANEFYDFDAKYENAASRTGIVRDLTDEQIDIIRDKALTVYRIMGCKGLSRVDFFLTENGTVVFNEINTLPGFTSISMYPQLWSESGIPYDELIDRLIQLALDNKSGM